MAASSLAARQRALEGGSHQNRNTAAATAQVHRPF